MACNYQDTDELDEFLTKIRLKRFKEQILEQEVISVEELQDTPQDTLVEMGMTIAEAKRLIRRVNEEIKLGHPTSPGQVKELNLSTESEPESDPEADQSESESTGSEFTEVEPPKSAEPKPDGLPFSPVPVCSKTTKRIISRQSIRINMNISYQLMTQFKPQVKKLNIPINGETMHYFDLVHIICEQERTILGNNLTIELYTCEGYPLATNPSCYISKLSDWCLETYDPILLYAVPRPKAFTVADQEYLTNVKMTGNDVVFIQNETLGFGPIGIGVTCNSVRVDEFKKHIYRMTSLPPSSYTLKFNNTALANGKSTLNNYKIGDKSAIDLEPHKGFPFSSWDQNFFAGACLARWSESQSHNGISLFFASLYTLSEWLMKKPTHVRENVLGHIRSMTGCAPLIHALKILFDRQCLSLPHRVAIQELLMLVFKTIGPRQLKGDAKCFTIQENKILEESTKFWAYFIEYAKDYHGKTEEYTSFDLCCSLKRNRMKEPKRLMDNKGIPHIVDKRNYEKQVGNEMFEPLPDYSRMIKSFSGFECQVWNVRDMKITEVDLTREWNAIESKFNKMPFLCIQLPLAIREKIHLPIPCMTLRENGAICNYIGPVKDTNKPYQGFDPMDGKTFSFNAEDVDEKLRKGKFSTFTELIKQPTGEVDFSTITRSINEIEEIIMVVLDTSGSMDSKYFEKKTKYELAMTGFIQFCNRTTAYNFKNMIGLVIFGGDSKLELELTESFTHFSKEIKTFPSKGKTAIYDAVIFTIDYLNSFRIKQGSPINLPARIICLTDGGDNASRKNPTEAANSLIRNNIVMDSVLLSNHKVGTHAIAKLSGGYSFQPSDQKDLLRIFENETMLNFNCRKHKNYLNKTFQEALTIHFDTEPEFLHPGKLTSTFQTSEKCLADAVLHKIVTSQVSPEVTKRILRELAYLQTDPHPSFEVFPCSDAVDLWHLMLEETAQTPYEGGVFRLYIEFTKEYPNKPPNIRFITPIYHCNINSAGRICHMILDRFYSPEKKIRELLDHIYGLLLEATPDDPLDSYKATLLRTNKQEYDRQAKAFTQLHAINKTKRQVRIDILGDEDVRNSYPAEFVCPLTLNLFKEPVTTRYGETYEKEAIESYLRDVAEQDPFSFQPLQLCQLVPNNLVKRGIEQFRARLSAL
eukprot:TRINITY_DN182_c0_g1_i11.p1 TRINITY_DN182_c0_g1~~TRINITY_DN182_c0_g1_i11.p1  ORF type:complete len:1151 (-),score=160.40 TRINITY_DN182_c0_g1_i11:220-3672(-)